MISNKFIIDAPLIRAVCGPEPLKELLLTNVLPCTYSEFKKLRGTLIGRLQILLSHANHPGGDIEELEVTMTQEKMRTISECRYSDLRLNIGDGSIYGIGISKVGKGKILTTVTSTANHEYFIDDQGIVRKILTHFTDNSFIEKVLLFGADNEERGFYIHGKEMASVRLVIAHPKFKEVRLSQRIWKDAWFDALGTEDRHHLSNSDIDKMFSWDDFRNRECLHVSDGVDGKIYINRHQGMHKEKERHGTIMESFIYSDEGKLLSQQSNRYKNSTCDANDPTNKIVKPFIKTFGYDERGDLASFTHNGRKSFIVRKFNGEKISSILRSYIYNDVEETVTALERA